MQTKIFFMFFMLIALHCQNVWALSFSPSEMLVMSVEEYREKEENPDEEIAKALAFYHSTQAYTQSLSSFRVNPNRYFKKRGVALERLLKILAASSDTQITKKIKTQALNKKSYIAALPSMADHRATKKNALPYFMKSLAVREVYWLEFLDPLHRFGGEASLRKHRWEVSSIPNYFIYLELFENDFLLNKYAPQIFQVTYFHTDQERESHKLIFKDGLVYHNGILFDTSEFYTVHSGKGQAIFTLGLDGEFYANNHLKYKLHHSSEFAGDLVLSAGEITAKNGKITNISNKSGHYTPSLSDLLPAISILEEKIGSLEGITASVIFTNVIEISTLRTLYDAKELLDNKEDALCISAQHEWNPLHVAILRGQIHLAEAALRISDINAKTSEGFTPLHLAIQYESKEWIEFLLANGADVTINSNRGYTPFQEACLLGNKKIIEKLFDRSKPEEQRSFPSPIFLVAKSGSINAYEYLLSKGFSASERDGKGNNVLFYSAFSKNEEFFKFLLSFFSQDLNAANQHGMTVLHFVAAFGTPNMLKILKKKGMDLYAVDHEGETIMHHAAKNGNNGVIDYLLENEMKSMVFSKNKKNITPLHYGATRLNFFQLEKMINLMNDPDPVDAHGETPLFYAIRGGDIRGILLFLEKGANPRIFNNAQMAPIHLSAMSFFFSINALLSFSDDINLLDGNGNTPLHSAVKSKNFPCVVYLLPYLSKEAILQKNFHGISAFDLAIEQDNHRLLKLLQEKINEE